MPKYQSPIGTRYDAEISDIWSETTRLRLLSHIWVNNHNSYVRTAGFPAYVITDPLVHQPDAYVSTLIFHAKHAEKVTGHELVALLETLHTIVANYNPRLPAKALLHTGLTSSDVLDQATLIQTLWSIFGLQGQMLRLLNTIVLGVNSGNYHQWLIGRTHLQKAEPTTILHRLLLFFQEMRDLLFSSDLLRTQTLQPYLGLVSGAVGTWGDMTAAYMATHSELPRNTWCRIKNQTLPRYLDYQYANLLDGIAMALHKLAFDFRLEAGFGSVMESEATERVGSSAMPYKLNPIRAEKICSLARQAHHLCSNAWDNAAWQGLDRTLDDSANRRMWLPEATILVSVILDEANQLLEDYKKVADVPPASWYDVWSQAREKSFLEAKTLLNPSEEYSPKAWTKTFVTGDLIDRRILAELAEQIFRIDWDTMLDEEQKILDAIYPHSKETR